MLLTTSGGSGVSGNDIGGNLIGTDATSTLALGNTGDGVRIINGANLNVVGFDGDGGAGNTIAYNAKGVVIGANAADTSTTGNTVSGNSIFANAGLGIDLGDDGVTPNGSGPSGPNDFQNHPVLTAVTSSSVSGYVLGAANTQLELDFYTSPVSASALEDKTSCSRSSS